MEWFTIAKFLSFFLDVILISPGWTTYAPQVRLAKQKCHILQTSMEDNWKVTPEKLSEFVQSRDVSEMKLMILNNPGNPCKIHFSKRTCETLHYNSHL